MGKQMGKRLTLLVLTVAVATVLAVGVAGAAPFVPSQTPDNTWNVSGTVFDTALSEDGETLYIGGKFTKVRKNPPGTPGTTLAVNNVAAIDVDTGAAIASWNPKV